MKGQQKSFFAKMMNLTWNEKFIISTHILHPSLHAPLNTDQWDGMNIQEYNSANALVTISHLLNGKSTAPMP